MSCLEVQQRALQHAQSKHGYLYPGCQPPQVETIIVLHTGLHVPATPPNLCLKLEVSVNLKCQATSNNITVKQ